MRQYHNQLDAIIYSSDIVIMIYGNLNIKNFYLK